jgi:TRAP-type C4-dicarboxylate transport system permease small subunit
MGALVGVARLLAVVNAAMLWTGRWLGAACIALMVVFILAQVFFRYVIGNALAWPEEASRFLMLWSAGLMIATAWRRGGLVAIDMLAMLLPRFIRHLLTLALLGLSMLILWKGLQIGIKEVTGISGRFTTDSLSVPKSLDLTQWHKVPKSWMMSSMVVGLVMMLAVGVELFLREVITMLGGADDLPVVSDSVSLGNE